MDKTGPLFSQLKLYPAKDSSGTFKGNGRVVVAGVAELNFRIVQGPTGLFVGWPGRQSDKVNPTTGKKQWFNDVRIVDEEANQELTKLILDEFRKTTGNNTGTSTPSKSPRPRQQQEIPF